jgi:hypothetical protein
MSTKAERAAAAAMLGRKGKGEAKRRGDAAHYAALRLRREGTVTITDMREAAESLRGAGPQPDGRSGPADGKVAAWLEREADRRERVNERRARERGR